MDYISLPWETQLTIAQFLEATEIPEPRGVSRLALACSAMHQHLTAVTYDNNKRYETAAHVKGTYIEPSSFNDFCADREKEGTLDKHRFSLFVYSKAKFIHYHGNGKEYGLPHINFRPYLATYCDIVFGPGEFADYTTGESSPVVTYVEHRVKSYAVGNTKPCEVFQCFEVEQQLAHDAGRVPHTYIDRFSGSLIGFDFAIRYTVV
jgi:hypothetical protein